MKRLIAFVLTALLPLLSFAAATNIDLSDALKKDMVKMEAVNFSGFYIGKTVRLTLTNSSDHTLEIKVDLGIILKPKNVAFQPMVLAGEETIKLKPREKGDLEVQTFCGNAPKACPVIGLVYSFLRVGGDTLTKVLRFIKDNGLNDHLGQSAVWAVTNNHSLGNIYDRDRDSISYKLIGVVADATHKPRPDYYTVAFTNETAAQPAYTAKTDKIYVPFNFTTSASKILTLGVFNSKGQWVKSIFDRKLFEAGKHNIIADIDPRSLDPDTYHLRLTDPEQTLQDKEIKIDAQ